MKSLFSEAGDLYPLTSLNDFLQSGGNLRVGDHIYFHNKADYPLKEEFDNSNYYYVKKDDDMHKLQICNMATQKIEEIDFKTIIGNVWVLKTPRF